MRRAGPCKDIPDRGGFACCRDESCHTQTPGPPRTYRFEYNVTFRRGAVPFLSQTWSPGLSLQGVAFHELVRQSSHTKQPCKGGPPRVVDPALCVNMRAGSFAVLCSCRFVSQR